MKRGLVVAGLVVLLSGLVLGFVPQSAHGVSCGSALVASDDARVSDLARTLGGAIDDGLEGLTPNEDACDDRLGVYKPLVWMLLAVGAGLLVAAMVTGNAKAPRPQPEG